MLGSLGDEDTDVLLGSSDGEKLKGGDALSENLEVICLEGQKIRERIKKKP